MPMMGTPLVFGLSAAAPTSPYVNPARIPVFVYKKVVHLPGPHPSEYGMASQANLFGNHYPGKILTKISFAQPV